MRLVLVVKKAIFKSHVKGHFRTSSSGKKSYVREHEDNRQKGIKVARSWWEKYSKNEQDFFIKTYYSGKYNDVNPVRSFISAIKKQFGGVENVELVKNGVVKQGDKTFAYSWEGKRWIELFKR